MHDQRADQTGVAEAHFGLGRMNIDIHLARIERHEQRHERVAVARQIVGVSGAHGSDEKLVAHRPAVDEQILAKRVGARERRQGGKAFDDDTVTLGADLDGIGAKVGAEHIAEPRQAAGRAGQRRGEAYRRALLAGEREGNFWTAHGKSAHHLAHRFGFSAVELEEFEPRRRGVEQIAHLDAGALPQRRRLDVGFGAGIDFDRPGMRLAGVARRDRKPGHGTDRRQGLAAEPERADRDQILVSEL